MSVVAQFWAETEGGNRPCSLSDDGVLQIGNDRIDLMSLLKPMGVTRLIHDPSKPAPGSDRRWDPVHAPEGH